MKNHHRIPTRAKWLLSLGALLATGVSSAWAFTPAGTEIRNQSTATYLDAANTPQIATSNEVINTVAPLYSVVVTPNATGATGFFAYDGTPALTQVSAPGNVAYYSYILENTGNAPDRFNADVRARAAGGAVIAPSAAGIEIYYDANGNGFVDAGDVLLDNSTAGSAAATPIVNPGQKIPLVVAVHTPSSATAAQRIETDFQVTGVTGSASDAASNWNRTTFAPGVGVVTAYKSADVTSVAPGRQDVTYTIQGSNTGSAAVSSVIFATGVDTSGDGTEDVVEGILIEDVLDITKIDVGANYANINPNTTGGQISPSTAIPLFWDDANSLWTATKPTQAASTSAGDIGKYKVALFIPDTDSVDNTGNGASDPVLSPGQSYRMSFTVDIRAGITATTLENEVSGQYVSGSVTRDFESNIHIIEIGGDAGTTTVDVELSPYTFLNGTTANLSAITNGTSRGSLEHPGVDALGLNASADTTSAGSETDADAHRNAGTTVTFPLTLTNPVATSSATDVFNISIVSGVPSGWVATVFKADGITPLADTNGDSRPDVGEVVPGGVVDLVVKVVIPDNSPAVPAASVITVRATSVKRDANTTVVATDDTLLRIPEVRPAGVDIAIRGQVSGDNSVQTAGDASADDDDDATGTAVQPGSNVAFAIQVANMRNRLQNAPRTADETTTAVDTYQLSVTKNGPVATTFDVVLFRDLNGDGVLDASELNPISDTGFLSPVATLTGAPLAVGTANLFNLLARVTVPSETPAGDYFVDVTATSTNRSAQTDTMRLLVRVVAAPSISVIPDNTATVVRGGSVTFKHVVVNTGNTTGTVQLSTAFPAGLFPTGYTAVFVSDTGAILGTDGATYVTPSLAPNQSQEFYVRIFVPANASVGATVPLTITGSGTAGGATLGAATDDAVDIITVIDGSLDLQKTNSPTGAVLPGGTIGYTTVFKNLGGASITDVVVFDAIPANSTFVAGSLAASGLPAGVTTTLEYSTNSGVSWVAVEPAAASVTNVRVKLVRTAALGVPLNGLLPGESGSFTFQVTVK